MAKTGRPRKWDDPNLMQKAVDDYFAECDNHILIKQAVIKGEVFKMEVSEPYTMAGLACALGLSRDALNHYHRARHRHMDAVDEEKARLFSYIISLARARGDEYSKHGSGWDL